MYIEMSVLLLQPPRVREPNCWLKLAEIKFPADKPDNVRTYVSIYIHIYAYMAISPLLTQ